MTNILLALAAILSPADSSICETIKTAIEYPSHYLQTHEDMTGKHLWASKDPAADPKFPWLALVDELIDRDLAIELDWNWDKDDILWNLNQLESYKLLSDDTGSSLATLHCADAFTINWLHAIAAQAASDDVVVAVMDIDSDSYIVVLLTRADYQRASHYAGQLGFKLNDIRELDPNKS